MKMCFSGNPVVVCSPRSSDPANSRWIEKRSHTSAKSSEVMPPSWSERTRHGGPKYLIQAKRIARAIVEAFLSPRGATTLYRVASSIIIRKMRPKMKNKSIIRQSPKCPAKSAPYLGFRGTGANARQCSQEFSTTSIKS